jgi:sulfoxide reductase heme-binding subunit YedZ
MAKGAKAPISEKAAPEERGLSRFLPGFDRAGRFSPIKAAAFLGGFAPVLWLIWAWRSQSLGPKPSSFVIHFFGDWAIRLLIVTLAVTPLRALTRWNALIGARRTLGRWALAYALAHLFAYALSEGMAKAIGEIFARFYLQVGGVALITLIVLGATSNDASIKRLGSAMWRGLHRLVYPAAALGLLHYLLQTKNDVTAPLMQVGLFCLLMGWRLFAWRRWSDVFALVTLALLAGLTTALFEAGWYYWRSGLSPSMILMGNFDVEWEIRPPLIVSALGFAAALFALIPGRSSRERTETAPRR